ncbi:MAG: B12-binding domain-containing radical SAM protein [Chloroflexi bacterium]|nr:B12-binding domain-containing radical SAM protein [Chloroflexota bacterium]
MDILFINPPLTMEERYNDLKEAGSSMPSLGLLILASIAREAGYDAGILDACAMNMDLARTLSRIKELRPKIAALTAVTLSIVSAGELASRIKEELPECAVIIGGSHFTAIPGETLREFPYFDAGVVGEGEITIKELIPAMLSGSALSGIKGVAFRSPGGEITVNEPREYLMDLDSIPPPAWDLLSGFPKDYVPASFRYRRLPAASLVVSRGCPNKCSFCDRSVFGSKIRSFSVDYIMKMLWDLKKNYGIKEILFEDDTFFLFKKKLGEMCKRMIDEKIDLSWSCLARADLVDRDLLKLMKPAGCWQVAYGIESADPKVLELMRKKVSPGQVENAVKWTREADILSKGFFILGFPGETKESFRRTLDFGKKIPLDDFSLFKITPFPGSELYSMAEQYGSFDRDWKKMNLLNTVFVPEGLAGEDMDSMMLKAQREFYVRPRIIFSYIKRMFSNPAFAGKILSGMKAFLRTQLSGGKKEEEK